MTSPANIQRIQSEYRRRIVEGWDIPAGSRILEIGCGQGDMTAVLAETVGENGFVTAVDIASPRYGAPQTLGEATAAIKASEIGHRIEFRLEFDVLEQPNAFQPGSFDFAVMAHCSWYFPSQEALQETLAAVIPWTKTLLFAEWDMHATVVDQIPHLLAVLIQGQAEGSKESSDANIRTPLPRDLAMETIRSAGWEINQPLTISTDKLQDADWEIHEALRCDLGHCPPKQKTILESYRALLKSIARPNGNVPLPAYSIVAKRGAHVG